MNKILGYLYTLVVVVFLLGICSCGETPTPPSSPKHSPSTREPPPSPPTSGTTKISRKVGAIPADLLAQTYDHAGTIPYDHKVQLEQLFTLEEKGKKLRLIIGRGNKETISGATGLPFQPLETQGGTRVWVYANADKDTLIKNNIPHLFMDFGNVAHLSTIPDGLFTGIVFDWSVAKFIDLTNAVIQYYRILRPGGLLFADLMLSGHVMWMTPAQKNMTCLAQQRTIYTTTTGREFCLKTWDTSIPYALGLAIATPAEEHEMNTKRINLIKNHLESIFGAGHCVQKNAGYPVPENNTDFLKCIK